MSRQPVQAYPFVRFLAAIFYIKAALLVVAGIAGFVVFFTEASVGGRVAWIGGAMGGTIWLIGCLVSAGIVAGMGQILEMLRQMAINSVRQARALRSMNIAVTGAAERRTAVTAPAAQPKHTEDEGPPRRPRTQRSEWTKP